MRIELISTLKDNVISSLIYTVKKEDPQKKIETYLEKTKRNE